MTELQWPPPAYLQGQALAGPVPGPGPAGPPAPGAPGAPALADAALRHAVTDILGVIAGRLDDGAEPAEVLPLIREAVRAWAERQARAGALIPSPADRDALAQAIYDQRYGLGSAGRERRREWL